MGPRPPRGPDLPRDRGRPPNSPPAAAAERARTCRFSPRQPPPPPCVRPCPAAARPRPCRLHGTMRGDCAPRIAPPDVTGGCDRVTAVTDRSGGKNVVGSYESDRRFGPRCGASRSRTAAGRRGGGSAAAGRPELRRADVRFGRFASLRAAPLCGMRFS